MNKNWLYSIFVRQCGGLKNGNTNEIMVKVSNYINESKHMLKNKYFMLYYNKKFRKIWNSYYKMRILIEFIPGKILFNFLLPFSFLIPIIKKNF